MIRTSIICATVIFVAPLKAAQLCHGQGWQPTDKNEQAKKGTPITL